MMAPSSSGLGRLVLIQKIAGSTPAGVTTLAFSEPSGSFLLHITEKRGLKSSVLHFRPLMSTCRHEDRWGIIFPGTLYEILGQNHTTALLV